MATKKTPAQLDRDIAHALAQKRRAQSTNRHHATVRDEWDVAMDALLERDAERAAEIVASIRQANKLPPYAAISTDATPEFVRALEKTSSVDVRDRFYETLKALQDAASGEFSPPRTMNVVDRHGGFTAVTRGGTHNQTQTLWRPARAAPGGTRGTLVPGSVNHDDFYQNNQPVTSALYKLPKYSYKVKVWWKPTGERIA